MHLRQLLSFAVLLPALAYAQTNTNNFEATALADAQKLFGLNFSQGKLEMMLPGLQEQLRDFEAVRQFPLSNSVPPALMFNPIPVGTKFDQTRKPFRSSSPGKVRLPTRRGSLVTSPFPANSQAL